MASWDRCPKAMRNYCPVQWSSRPPWRSRDRSYCSHPSRWCRSRTASWARCPRASWDRRPRATRWCWCAWTSSWGGLETRDLCNGEQKMMLVFKAHQPRVPVDRVRKDEAAPEDEEKEDGDRWAHLCRLTKSEGQRRVDVAQTCQLIVSHTSM